MDFAGITTIEECPSYSQPSLARPLIRTNRNGVERRGCEVRVKDQIIDDYAKDPEHTKKPYTNKRKRRFRYYLDFLLHAMTKCRS